MSGVFSKTKTDSLNDSLSFSWWDYLFIFFVQGMFNIMHCSLSFQDAKKGLPIWPGLSLNNGHLNLSTCTRLLWTALKQWRVNGSMTAI